MPNQVCTALTHLIASQPDLYNPVPEYPYFCCINAGVSKVHLSGLAPCRDRCECHEMPEDWRPEN